MQLDAWKEALPENVDMSFDFEKSKNSVLSNNPDQWAKMAAQSINLQGIRPKAAANIGSSALYNMNHGIRRNPSISSRNPA
jgi:hypothetical protein